MIQRVASSMNLASYATLNYRTCDRWPISFACSSFLRIVMTSESGLSVNSGRLPTIQISVCLSARAKICRILTCASSAMARVVQLLSFRYGGGKRETLIFGTFRRQLPIGLSLHQ